MKIAFHHLLTLIALGLASANAATITDSATYTPNLAIPDGSTVGLVDARTFSSQIATISEVRVSLSIAGSPAAGDAFNGDLYVTLAHSSGFAVLLNRPGRTALNDFGYADSGFDVTLADTPGSADIHNYRLTLNPNGGALTGVWGSDGRNVNPNLALDTTLRNARLDSFNGLNPNGQWSLFVADVSPVGTARLASWKLEVTGQTPVIPEPGTALSGLLCAVACASGIFSRPRR